MKPRFRRGVVLLQTLVLSVVLSMMAVMVMKWVLARYMLAARNYRSNEAVAHSQYVNSLFSAWNFGAVGSSGYIIIDQRRLSYQRSVGSSYRITMEQEKYE